MPIEPIKTQGNFAGNISFPHPAMDNSLSCQVNILRARSVLQSKLGTGTVQLLHCRGPFVKPASHHCLSQCSRSSARGMTTDAVVFGGSHRDNSVIEPSLRTPKM